MSPERSQDSRSSGPKPIVDDELLKGVCHGLLLGCLLPIVAYNVMAGKKRNILVYTGLIAFEVGQIIGHIRDWRK